MEHIPDQKVLVQEVKTTISYIEVFLLFLGSIIFWCISIIIINGFTLTIMGEMMKHAFFLYSENQMPFSIDSSIYLVFDIVSPILPIEAIISAILVSIIPMASLIIYLLVITHALKLNKRRVFFSCASLMYVPVIFTAYAVLINVITYNMFKQVSFISLVLYPLLGIGALLYLLSQRIEEIDERVRGFMTLVFPWALMGIITIIFIYLSFIKDYSNYFVS